MPLVEGHGFNHAAQPQIRFRPPQETSYWVAERFQRCGKSIVLNPALTAEVVLYFNE